MNPEVLNWLKKQGPIGLLILFLWIFRDQISFTIRFGPPPAAASVSAGGDSDGRALPGPAGPGDGGSGIPQLSP